MTTLELAKKKYARKMAKAGPIWKKRVTDKTEDFAKGVARFLELPTISEDKKAAWKEGVDEVTAEDYAEAVKGKEVKWADRLKEVFAP